MRHCDRLYVPGDTWLHRLRPDDKTAHDRRRHCPHVHLHRASPGGATLLLVFLIMLGRAAVLGRAAPIFIGVAIIAVTFVIVQGSVHPGQRAAAISHRSPHLL